MIRLKELRRERGMTQEALGRAIGVQKAAICKYETGRVPLPPEAMMKLCDLFGVSADHLMGRDVIPLYKGAPSLSSRFMPIPETVGIPLVGRVHAGLPILAEENITDYIPLPAGDAKGGDYFYMEVEGDCMIGACIPEGALVLVRLQPKLENGQIGVIRLEDQVLLRRIKWMPPQLMLIPANINYEPLMVDGNAAEIVGRVVEVRIRNL